MRSFASDGVYRDIIGSWLESNAVIIVRHGDVAQVDIRSRTDIEAVRVLWQVGRGGHGRHVQARVGH